jgi:hypothetical protein
MTAFAKIPAVQVTLGHAGGPSSKRKPRVWVAGLSMRNAQEEPRIALILPIENERS